MLNQSNRGISAQLSLLLSPLNQPELFPDEPGSTRNQRTYCGGCGPSIRAPRIQRNQYPRDRAPGRCKRGFAIQALRQQARAFLGRITIAASTLTYSKRAAGWLVEPGRPRTRFSIDHRTGA